MSQNVSAHNSAREIKFDLECTTQTLYMKPNCLSNLQNVHENSHLDEDCSPREERGWEQLQNVCIADVKFAEFINSRDTKWFM